MKVRVDDDRCGGHGVCCTLCPAVFRLCEDGFAVAYVSEVPPDLEESVRKAIAQCPTRAIVAE